jgi:hypothetical protein
MTPTACTIPRPYEVRPMIRAGGPTVAVVPTCPIGRATCSVMCRYWRQQSAGEVECGYVSHNKEAQWKTSTR